MPTNPTTVMNELRGIFSLEDSALIVERVRDMKDRVEQGGDVDEESDEFWAAENRHNEKTWAILQKWKALAEGVENGDIPTVPDAAPPENSVAVNDLVEVLGVGSLAFVLPQVRALRDAYVRATGGDDIVHYYDNKLWQNIHDWKARAAGLERPYGMRTLTIRVGKPLLRSVEGPEAAK